MTEPILELTQIRKSFGQTVAVNGLSLRVFQGEILGLLGPNGSGKTTTIRLITGLCRPDEGNIRLFGGDLAEDPMIARRLAGIVPDADELPDDLSAEEFLDFVAAVRKIPREESRRRIREWLEVFGLEQAGRRLLRGFSHGMRKKVQFIAALLHQPQLLILDEPTTGLDPDMLILLKQMMLRLRDKGTAILLSTHQLDFAQELCNRVCLIRHGQKLAEDRPQELLGTYRATALEEVYLRLTDAGRKAGELDALLADW